MHIFCHAPGYLVMVSSLPPFSDLRAAAANQINQITLAAAKQLDILVSFMSVCSDYSEGIVVCRINFPVFVFVWTELERYDYTGMGKGWFC